MIIPDETLSSFEALSRTCALFTNGPQSHADLFSPLQLMKLARAYRASAWGIPPHLWTYRQTEEALANSWVPEWVDGEVPFYDPSRVPPKSLGGLLGACRIVDVGLPPAPWEADIDDPETAPELTGKFKHPDVPPSGSVLCLYNEPEAAIDIATMRNLFRELLEALSS